MRAGFNPRAGVAIVPTGERYHFIWLRNDTLSYERDVDYPLASRHIRMTNSTQLQSDDVDYNTLEEVGVTLKKMVFQGNTVVSIIHVLDSELPDDLRLEMVEIIESGWNPDLEEYLKDIMYRHTVPPTACFRIADTLTGQLAEFLQGLPKAEAN